MATSYSAQKAEEKKKIDQMVNKNIEQINKNYDAGIDDLSKKYDDQQRAVAVQKLINERKVAESMANLGVTDSGLNRTQQTAVQLSAANQAYNLNRQKQADINAYNLERDNRIAEIEQSRLSSHLSLDDKYLQLEESAKAAQANAEAESANTTSYIIKTNNGLLPSDYNGTLKDNGVDHYKITKSDGDYYRYVDNNSGKVLELPVGVNPHTGTVNKDIEHGAFENGYQPNNVNGVKLKAAYLPNGQVAGYYKNGYWYRIHRIGDNFYIWNRSTNKYDEYTKAELEKKGVNLY